MTLTEAWEPFILKLPLGVSERAGRVRVQVRQVQRVCKVVLRYIVQSSGAVATAEVAALTASKGRRAGLTASRLTHFAKGRTQRDLPDKELARHFVICLVVVVVGEREREWMNER